MQQGIMQIFSESQEYFAAVTADNRLKVWDVNAGTLEHDLKERDHLSFKYTSIAWTQKSPMEKKDSKRSKTAGLGIIALGTNLGEIILWDLQKGEVVRKLSREIEKDGHASAVNDIAFNTQGNLLYSCSSEKNVLEWNMRDGSIARKFRVGSEGAMKVAVSAEDETLAVGGTAIRTFDLTSGKKTRKLTAGLSSTVNQLVFSKCKRFLFSSTIGGRFVNLYDLNLDQDEPVLNFSMPSSSSSLFAHVESQKKKSNVLLGAVSNTGSLFLWRHKYKNESSTQPLIPTVTTKVKNGSFASILLAGLKYQEENAIVVARGSLLKPVFEKTKLVDKHNNFLETLEFEAISDNLLLGTQQKPSNNKKQKVEDENEKTHIPNLAERGGPKMSDMKDMSEEFVIAVDEESEDDLTLAEKVEALREQVESDLAAELRRVEDAEKVMEQGEKPDASSLSSVLEQALQTKDNSMLEYCLRTRDPKIINNTIKRVSSVKILQLLDAIVVKFEKSPGRCSRLCPWIRSILLNHTAYLMTQPDLVQNLSALYQILENRLKVHEQLQKLSGRLSLVIGQINEASYAAETDGESDAAPRIVYHEDEENDKEVDDTKGVEINGEKDEHGAEAAAEEEDDDDENEEEEDDGDDED